VLIAGGLDSGGNPLMSTELYDPATNTFATSGTPTMNTARYLATATLLPNGKVLIAGGFGSFDFLASTDLFDPGANSFLPSDPATMNTARDSATATLLLNGQVLIAGGNSDSGTLASTELYGVPASIGDTIADLVLGQPDFFSGACNKGGTTNASSLCAPEAIAENSSGNVYVADTTNHRVLGYKDVTTSINGGPADLVIGQLDFVSGACNNGAASPSASSLCFPESVAVDVAGNLYVADEGNNRVLEYNNPFAGCGSFPCVGGSANLVFGQLGSFTSNTPNNGGLTANSLSAPNGVASDGKSGNLYVTDDGNNRVLEYNKPLTTDTTADLVFGQSLFSTAICSDGKNADPPPSATGLCHPEGVAYDFSSGNLYVADRDNNRVLEYNTPLLVTATPGSGDTTADLVFGQGGSFTSNTQNNGGTSASSLFAPVGVALDINGNLYVDDDGNNRVLEYNAPLTTNTADLVFGQSGSFSSSACNNGGINASSLCDPLGVALDARGDLYVADANNNRVLKYNQPLGP